MRILVTGAAGHLGGKLPGHLSEVGHSATGLDLRPRSGPLPVQATDLAQLDTRLQSHLDGQDVVAHLAADRSPASGWGTVIPHNMDAVLNVLEAARRGHVPPVVFASSTWVLGGYRFKGGDLQSDTVAGARNSPHDVSDPCCAGPLSRDIAS